MPLHNRNLLTPILVHGAWNSTVLTLLFLLASYGVDIEEFVGAAQEGTLLLPDWTSGSSGPAL